MQAGMENYDVRKAVYSMKNRLRYILFAMLTLVIAICFMAFGAAAEETATPEPLITPAPEELSSLTFVITGPDERMPMTVTYGELKDGKFEMEGLAPGSYTVTEVDPDKLLEDFTYDPDSSISSVTIEVTKEGTEAGVLKNVYATELPTATPTPVPTPITRTKDIPVSKSWVDNNNQDGNRPSSVTVYLYADGVPVAQAVLNEGNGWAYTFRNVDQNDSSGREIVYTVGEEAVAMYTAEVNGYHIVNTYQPALTKASVRKIWDDQDNAVGFRPESIHATLSNGTTVVLNQENGWSATVDNLPTVVNGEVVQYTWTEQEVLGYEAVSASRNGTETVFTNRLRQRDQLPERPDSPKKKGTNYIIISEYGTPLGVSVTINHVGDCFE